jgi:hypothetical protein
MKHGTLILIMLLVMGVLTSIASAAYVQADNSTETSIVWNLSGLPAGTVIASIAFDGVILTNYDPNSTFLVQNNLYPSETHLITVMNSLGTKYEATATTQDSPQTWMWTQINTWLYLAFIITVMVIALTVRRNPVLCFVMNFIAAALSLYMISLWIGLHEVWPTEPVLLIPFYTYIFFFVFPLVAFVFERKK